MIMQLVWFKRDLRVEDNLPLTLAAQDDAVIPLYILEPELWQQPDLSYRQYLFLQDSLKSLDEDLQKLGQRLIIRIGDAVNILEELTNQYNITSIWSHQETWNDWTYQRDKRVQKWLVNKGIVWNQLRQHGVIRKLANRDGWSLEWYKFMKQPPVNKPPKLEAVAIDTQVLPSAYELGLKNDGILEIQIGGRKKALEILNSFLCQRGEGYTKEMSSPLTAYQSCSRLSPYIAFGTISIREIFHAVERRSLELKQLANTNRWQSAMRSFAGRLRWHCHFIQKLEDEPQIEFRNMHSAYDGLRENDFNHEYFECWKAGKTGYPMIDACMRALIHTGWINFRMRAMLVSFASYHLWLDWRYTAPYLAGLFTDYEPGIHYSQFQMQSGTTGINTLRIYNPIKQGIDHDPEGVFIRQWIPELSAMPKEYIHLPWLCSALMNGYPLPVVDEKIARNNAAKKLYDLRKQSNHKGEVQQIVHKHASRKTRRVNTKKPIKKQELEQMELEL